ncbi:MAG TPA: family 43 glycosylhydrolase [Candidatus Sulfotelmatobacter sp.]|jgi:hypothetical protein|nr:family 43 glycosylhydrolase [Candidatus Sulfotelmatobacter sp.]
MKNLFSKLPGLRKLAHIAGRLSIGTCVLALCLAQITRAQTNYSNPLVSIANDPHGISYFCSQYNMVTGNGGSMIYRSSQDLVHWSGPTTILTLSGYNFWVGHQIQDPTNGTIWMYYTVINTSTSVESIGLAYASAANSTSWTITSFSIVNGIDPYFFRDADGSMYLYYKDDQSDKSIWVQKLSSYTAKSGSPIELVSPGSGWESCGSYATCEGPAVKKISGKYFMLYAGGNFSESCYSIGYAYSSSPTGPFTKGANNPIMSVSTSPGWSIGAPSIVTDGNNNPWVTYRTWATPGTGTRQVCIEPLEISSAASGTLSCTPKINVSQTAPAGVDDFDHDGIPDAVYYDTATTKWNIRHSADGLTNSFQLGSATMKPLLGGLAGSDFNQDGVLDTIMYDPSTFKWYVRNGANGALIYDALVFGTNGCIPLLGDFDGDSIPDFIYVDTNSFNWHARYSNGGSTHTFQFGARGDIPMMGATWPGQQTPSAVVFRPSNKSWYVRDMNNGNMITDALAFGTNGCIPLVGGDFDGDGIPDFVYIDTNSFTWFVRNSSDGSTNSFQFGQAGDIPMLGGSYTPSTTSYPSPTVYRPSNQTWYVFDGPTFQFGSATAIPVH